MRRQNWINPRKWCPASDKNVIVLYNNIGYHNVGSTQYYSTGVDKSNKHDNEKVRKLLKYAVSYQDAIVMYHASDMILAYHIDA